MRQYRFARKRPSTGQNCIDDSSIREDTLHRDLVCRLRAYRPRSRQEGSMSTIFRRYYLFAGAAVALLALLAAACGDDDDDDGGDDGGGATVNVLLSEFVVEADPGSAS